MIPLPEFVALIRKELDAKIVALERLTIEGQATTDAHSVEATALGYVGAVNRMVGLRAAREIIDDQVRKLNAGGL